MAKKPDEEPNPIERFMNQLRGASGEGGPKSPDPSQKKVHFSFWYFIVALLLITWLQSYLAEPPREKIQYSEFKQWVRDGKVENLVVQAERIRGEFKDDKGQNQHFVTVRVEDPELVQLLDQKGVKYSGYAENKWVGLLLSWLLPLAFFIFFWSFLIKRMGGGPQGVLSVGKARVKIYRRKRNGNHFRRCGRHR